MKDIASDFDSWEREQESGFIIVQNSLTLAQELQKYINTLPPDLKVSAWVEAIHALRRSNGVRDPYLVHTELAFAFLLDHKENPDDEDEATPTHEFGEIQVKGEGIFGYSTYTNYPSLMVNLFDPEFLKVTNPEDEIVLPPTIPVSIPVLSIKALAKAHS